MHVVPWPTKAPPLAGWLTRVQMPVIRGQLDNLMAVKIPRMSFGRQRRPGLAGTRSDQEIDQAVVVEAQLRDALFVGVGRQRSERG